MTQDLTFYTNPMSRGRIVRWMLEEIGQPYRTEVLEYGTTMKSREYLAINPMGKVPAIRHDGKIVTEAAAICAYLADVEAAGANRSLGFEVPPDKERMIGYGNFASVVDSIERAVSAGPYIAGDSFTAADVYCGAQIGWGMQFESIERRPAFEAYFRRVSQRPAYARAAELDDALAKQS
jgi:glutathione S-transferase